MTRLSDRSGVQEEHAIAVYRKYLPVVYGYLVHRLGGRRADAEELTQEVFLAYVAVVRTGSPPDDPRGWLVTVARNKMVDHLRRATRPMPPPPPAPPDETATVDAVVSAGEMLERLPPAQRAAMILRYVDDLPVAEVAAVLGRSVRACESLLSRARRTLAEGAP